MKIQIKQNLTEQPWDVRLVSDFVYLFGRLRIHDAGPKVADEIKNEEGIWEAIKDEPTRTHVLIVEESNDDG